jgi:sulfate adenylyltransferase subunit 1 (EFTu-like GTPase family)
MDLVDFDQAVFDQIEAEYRAFADALTFKTYYRDPAVSAAGRQCDRAVEPHNMVFGAHVAGLFGNRGNCCRQ